MRRKFPWTLVGLSTVISAIACGGGTKEPGPGSGTDGGGHSGPPPPSSGTGLRGEYFDSDKLTNSVLVRVDSKIDFDWRTSPPSGVPLSAAAFSVRWTGQVAAQQATSNLVNMVTAPGAIAVVIFLGVAWPLPAAHASGECPVEDIREVPAGTFSSQTWSALHQSWRRFRGCDNGGEFSASYTEDIISLLVNQWDRLPELAALLRKEPRFEAFVLKHVNATASSDELNCIIRSARDTCPSTSRSLCRKLGEQAAKALTEAGGK
jgi:hypothetical protein